MATGDVWAYHKGINAMDLCRLFIDAGANELFIGDILDLKKFCGSIAAFEYLQQQVYPAYHDFPIKERLQVARGILWFL